MPRIFPLGKQVENRVIQTDAKYGGNGFLAILSSRLPDLHCNGDSQCFPRWFYEQAPGASAGALALSNGQASGLTRRDAITEPGLGHFQAAYPGATITNDDLFHS